MNSNRQDFTRQDVTRQRFPRQSVIVVAMALTVLSAAAQTKKAATATPKSNAQTSLPAAAPVQINRMVVVLDAAHGGFDSGSRLDDATVEKNVTLALAFKLRSLLSARGFAVVMTRDADTPAEPGASGSTLTLDDRAGMANHAHAVACLLLHATASGTGVHLYNSDLEAGGNIPLPAPWLTAQSAWVPQSNALRKLMASSLIRAGVPIVASTASVRPVDSLTCPALVIELAPETSAIDSINRASYQQRVAQAIAGSLLFWRNQAQPPQRYPAATSKTAHPPISHPASPRTHL